MKKITLLILCMAMITLCACDNAQPQTSVSAGPSIEATDSPAPSVEISVAPTSFTQAEMQYYYDSIAGGKAVDESGKKLTSELDAIAQTIQEENTPPRITNLSLMQVINSLGKPHSYCLRKSGFEVWEYKRDCGGQYWIITSPGSPKVITIINSNVTQTFDEYGGQFSIWLY